MKIGVIGKGRFGNLVIKTLQQKTNAEVLTYEKGESEKSLQIMFECDVVIPCIPISQFEEFFKNNGKNFKPQSMILDIASIKVHTTKVLKKYLPKNVEIFSTHPMFGPTSTQDGTVFKDLKFIYYKTRIFNEERFNQIMKFLKDLGLQLFELTPEEHDRQAAYTQGFAFLIGRVGIEMNLRKNVISTKGFDAILYNQEAVEKDTIQLFNDMQTYNPFAKLMRKEVLKTLKSIEKQLKYK